MSSTDAQALEILRRAYWKGADPRRLEASCAWLARRFVAGHHHLHSQAPAFDRAKLLLLVSAVAGENCRLLLFLDPVPPAEWASARGHLRPLGRCSKTGRLLVRREMRPLVGASLRRLTCGALEPQGLLALELTPDLTAGTWVLA